MASVVANLSPSPLFVSGRQSRSRTLQKFTVSVIGERQGRVAVIAKAIGENSEFSASTSIVESTERQGRVAVIAKAIGENSEFSASTSIVESTERRGRVSVIAKATGESSESSTSLSIVESVQNVWDKSEDRIALIGLGFAGIVALWASANLITAVDKLPLIPSVFEFVGILFSSWFIYRYLLFKPDREELFQIVNKSISDVLGQ